MYDGTKFTASLLGEYEPKDAAVTEKIATYQKDIETLYGETIGQTEVFLNGERIPNRTQGTNLGDLATDAILYAANEAGNAADIGLTNGGGIRVSVPAGPITKYDLVNVFPFGNQVVVFDITGAALLEALESNTEALPEAEGGFPQVSGLKFRVDTAKTENRVTILEVGGQPFDAAATYTVATNDFIGAGGDKYGVFGDFYEGKMSGINLEDAMIDYIQDSLGGAVGSEYTLPQGRAVTVPADITGNEENIEAIYYVLGRGIMNGVGGNEFDPDGTVTRAMLYQTLYMASGQSGAAGTFTDVAEDAWYAKSAAWAKENGFVTDAEYNAGLAVITEEVNNALAKLAELEGFDFAAVTADGPVTREELAGLVYAVMPAAAPADASSVSEAGGASDSDDAASAVELVDKYGNLTLTTTTQELVDGGFEFGDLVTVTVGENAIEAPFGTGYSDVDTGSVVVRGSTDMTAKVIVAINMGNFSTTYSAAAGDEVTIAMKEKGGYFNEWEIRQLERTDERADYASDEVFANFRSVELGDIAPGVYYRSSSPVNNEIGRAAYADGLAEKAGIATAINLANSKEELEGYFAGEGFDSPYYKKLYDGGDVVYLAMGVDFSAADFQQKLKQGLEFMIANDGPYVVHCTEGKDRAGFVSGLIEALMGATADEIKEDYMLSFVNYYHVEKGSEQYNRIAESNILESLRSIAGLEKGASLTGVDLVKAATDYLVKIGLTTGQIGELQEKLSTPAAAELDNAA